MTKKQKNELEDQLRYDDYYEQYEGLSLHILVERRRELKDTPGSDIMELEAIQDIINTMDCDLDPYGREE